MDTTSTILGMGLIKLVFFCIGAYLANLLIKALRRYIKKYKGN